MTNIDTNGMNDLVPGTNLTYADAAAMHKDYLRDQRCARVLNGSRRSRRNRTGNRSDNANGFYVLTADGRIDKQATRERRLFGEGGPQVEVIETPDVELHSTWDGTYSFRPDGSIDKRATRERRIFGEPVEDDRWSCLVSH